MHDVHVKHFKVDSSACGNLIPLSLYLDLFPNSSVRDLQSTIDHRVQLVAYNKNLIKQYGTCYLKVNQVVMCTLVNSMLLIAILIQSLELAVVSN